MCEDWQLKGKKKLERKGVSESTGAPLGAEGEHGVTAGDAGWVPWQHKGEPWPHAPVFGSGADGAAGAS